MSNRTVQLWEDQRESDPPLECIQGRGGSGRIAKSRGLVLGSADVRNRGPDRAFCWSWRKILINVLIFIYRSCRIVYMCPKERQGRSMVVDWAVAASCAPTSDMLHA